MDSESLIYASLPDRRLEGACAPHTVSLAYAGRRYRTTNTSVRQQEMPDQIVRSDLPHHDPEHRHSGLTFLHLAHDFQLHDAKVLTLGAEKGPLPYKGLLSNTGDRLDFRGICAEHPASGHSALYILPRIWILVHAQVLHRGTDSE